MQSALLFDNGFPVTKWKCVKIKKKESNLHVFCQTVLYLRVIHQISTFTT